MSDLTPLDASCSTALSAPMSKYDLFMCNRRSAAGKVTFESIKSHGSTGSTGSKTSTTSTGSEEVEFSASSLSAASKIAAGNPRIVEKVQYDYRGLSQIKYGRFKRSVETTG